jgi:hypothetical protein
MNNWKSSISSQQLRELLDYMATKLNSNHQDLPGMLNSIWNESDSLERFINNVCSIVKSQEVYEQVTRILCSKKRARREQEEETDVRDLSKRSKFNSQVDTIDTALNDYMRKVLELNEQIVKAINKNEKQQLSKERNRCWNICSELMNDDTTNTHQVLSLSEFVHIEDDIYERSGSRYRLTAVKITSVKLLADIVSKLQHMYIRPITNIIRDLNQLYVESPIIELEDLDKWKIGKSVDQLRAMILMISRAVEFIHRSGMSCSGLKGRVGVTKNSSPVLDMVASSCTTDPFAEQSTSSSDIWDFGILVCDIFSNDTTVILDRHSDMMDHIFLNIREELRGNIFCFTLISRLLRFDKYLRPSMDIVSNDPFLINSIGSPDGTPVTTCNFGQIWELIDSTCIINDESYILEVDPGDVLKTGLQVIGRFSTVQLLQQLLVYFNGEQGLDSGALTTSLYSRIFQALICDNHLMQSPNSNEFILSDKEGSTGIFKALGKLCAKMIVERRPLPVRLASYIWKFITKQGFTIDLAEMDIVDPIVTRSYKMLLSSDDALNSCLENSDSEPVTEENKSRYIQERIVTNLISRREDNLLAFKKGFQAIRQLPMILGMMDISSIQLLISPQEHIDVQVLISCLKFRRTSSRLENYVSNVIQSLNQSQLRKFLHFVTGQSNLLSVCQSSTALWNPNESAPARDKITVEVDSRNNSSLPTASVCFYTLKLPEYETEEALKQKLLTAIEMCSDVFELA